MFDRPVWLNWLSFLLSLVGLAAAAWLTWAHFTSTSVLVCPDSGFINCAEVTTSSYSVILGIPVAVLGLLFFLAVVPLMTPWAWRSHLVWVARIRLAAMSVGMIMVLWLVYAELFGVGKLCIYCTSVHIVVFLLFMITMWRFVQMPDISVAGVGDE